MKQNVTWYIKRFGIMFHTVEYVRMVMKLVHFIKQFNKKKNEIIFKLRRGIQKGFLNCS